MILIRAYIRTIVVYDVIQALTKAGAQWLSVVNVMGLGEELDREKMILSSEVGKYTKMAKLEFVCNEPCKEVAVKIIRKLAAKGADNDGIIVVSPVNEAISVKTGERGGGVLCRLKPLSDEELDELNKEWE
jgi:nitrogen regulatory protein P-II 1